METTHGELPSPSARSEPALQRDIELLFDVLRERLIKVRTMQPPLRRLTWIAFAAIGLAALLLAIRDVPGLWTMDVYSLLDNRPLQMPVLTFIISAGMLILAWSCLLVGALCARGALRFVGPVVYSYAMLTLRPPLRPSIRILEAILLLLAWGAAAVLWQRRRRQRQRFSEQANSQQFHPITFFLCLGLTCMLFGLSYYAGRPAQRFFTTQLAIQLSKLAFLLVPVLLVAGADWAELGDASAIALIKAFVRPLPASVTILALVLAASLTIGGQIIHAPLAKFYERTLGGAVAIFVVAALLWTVRGHRLSAHVSTRVVVSAALFTIALFYIVPVIKRVEQWRAVKAKAVVQTSPLIRLYTYARTNAPTFSIKYPTDWKITPVNGKNLTVAIFNGAAGGDPAMFTVVALRVRSDSAGPRILSDSAGRRIFKEWIVRAVRGARVTLTPRAASHGWQCFDFVMGNGGGRGGRSGWSGIDWQRIESGRAWLLYGMSPKSAVQRYLPTFAAMAASFSTAPGKATATARDYNDNVKKAARLTFLVVWLGWLLAAAILCLQFVRHRTTEILYLLLVGVFTCLAGLGEVKNWLPHLRWIGMLGLSLKDFQSAAAIAGLLWSVWIVVRRQINARVTASRLLLLLLLSLQALSWLQSLFKLADDQLLTKFGGLALLLALTWDALMSGALTNRDGKLAPRGARVLLYFGFLMFVACEVLFFASLHVAGSGGHLKSQLFESDFWVQEGILFFGIPLLVTLFIARFAKLHVPLLGVSSSSS